MTERLHVSVTFQPSVRYVSEANHRVPRSLTALSLGWATQANYHHGSEPEGKAGPARRRAPGPGCSCTGRTKPPEWLQVAHSDRCTAVV
jgi:hypothetical protein